MVDWSAVPFLIRANDYKHKKRTTMRKLIFGLLAIVGIFVAVETKDESEYELLIRGTGVFVFGLSTYLGGWWDLASEDTQKAKTDNTQNKPLK